MAYGEDSSLIDYLALTGRVLPVEMSPAVARQWGSSYVNLFEDKYRGVSTAPPDSFPRNLWPVVPLAIEHATYEAAFAYASGVDLFGTGGTAGGQVIEERVDVLSVKYAAPEGGSAGYWDNSRFILPLAYALLRPYMGSGYGVSAFVV